MNRRTGPLRWQHGAAAGLLAGFVLWLYSQLLYTDRVLAGGDIQLYFYPYWSYTGAQLRAGELPFWNPYLFLGGPLLANPQAAVLYPLHWPLFAAGGWGLPVTDQIYWSAALHTWLLGLGGYALLRFWGYGWMPALLAGLLLAGSGFVGWSPISTSSTPPPGCPGRCGCWPGQRLACPPAWAGERRSGLCCCVPAPCTLWQWR